MSSNGVAQRNALFARHAVNRIIAAGCAGFVVSPGSRNSPLVMAIADTAAQVDVVLDERSAGFFALGRAKAARAPIALVCTSGSAGAHYLPAVIEAHETGVPLIVVTADRPPELQEVGAPQTTRQDRLFGNHLKGFLAVGAADDDGADSKLDTLSELLQQSCDGKPGPIHLNIGFREPLWEPGTTQADAETTVETGPLPSDTIEPIEIPDAGRGLLVVGPIQEARPDAREAVEALASLAQARGWPVVADIASGLRYICGYEHFLQSRAARAALEPELVIHVGRMPTSKSLFTWMQNLEDSDVPVLHLSTDGQPHSLGRQPRIIDVTWQQLLQSCNEAREEPRSPGQWLARWQEAEREVAAEVEAHFEDTECWEGAVARAATRLPDGTRLLMASGMPIRDVDTFVRELPARTDCLVNRGVNGIDGLIATAAGVASQDPDRHTRLILGDLAFLHDLGSLALAAQRRNLDIVVVNNSGGGIFEFLPISQAGERFEKFFLTPQQTDIQAVAGSFGIEAHRCTSIPRLEELLSAPLQGPRIVEAVVERAHNVYIHEKVSAAVVARLDKVFHSEDKDGEGSGAGQRSLESR